MTRFEFCRSVLTSALSRRVWRLAIPRDWAGRAHPPLRAHGASGSSLLAPCRRPFNGTQWQLAPDERSATILLREHGGLGILDNFRDTYIFTPDNFEKKLPQVIILILTMSLVVVLGLFALVPAILMQYTMVMHLAQLHANSVVKEAVDAAKHKAIKNAENCDGDLLLVHALDPQERRPSLC